MTDSIYQWSTVPADNATADGSINWSENQDPDTVNNSARGVMSRVAELLDDATPTRSTSGTGNVYTVTAQSAPTTLPDGFLVVFHVNRTNTGPATLAVNSYGAVALRAKSGVELAPGELIVGTAVLAYYRASTAEFIAVNTGLFVSQMAGSVLSANVFGLKVGDPILSLNPTPNPGFIRLTETAQAIVKADYPDLNAWASGLGYPWGSASSTFNVPPAAGYFLRFAPTTSGIDPGGARAAGGTQTDMVGPHTHAATSVSSSTATANNGNRVLRVFPGSTGGSLGGGGTVEQADVTVAVTTTTATTVASNATAETRPKNVAFHVDILAVPALIARGLVGTVGYAYSYSTDTAPTYPGAGFLRFNNTDLASATVLYIAETDSLGVNQSGGLAQWTSSTSVVRGVLTLVKVGNPAVTASFSVTGTMTDNGAWNAFDVASLGVNGTFANLDKMHVSFARTGDKGDATGSGGGGGSGDVVGPSSAVNGRMVEFDGTTGKLIKDGGVVVSAFMKTVFDDADAAAARATLGVGSGSGDVVGPASVVNNRMVEFDGTTGKVIKDGGVAVSAFMKTMLDDADAAAARATLGVGSGSGDVIGPSSSINGRIAEFDGTTGKLLKDGGVAITAFAKTILDDTSAAAVRQTIGADRYVNIKSHGALGDGSNCDAAFTAAMAVLNAGATGGMIYFPAGSYRLSNLTINKSGVTLVGDGVGATSILSVDATGSFITFDGSASLIENCGVRDLTIAPGGSPKTSGPNIFFNKTQRNIVDSVDMVSAYNGIQHGSSGEDPNGTFRTIITRVRRTRITSTSDGIVGYPTSGLFVEGDCQFNGTLGAGSAAVMLIGKIDGVHISPGCVIETHDYGVRGTVSSGSLANVYINGVVFDRIGVSNIAMVATTTGGLNGLFVNNCFFDSRIGAGDSNAIDISHAGTGATADVAISDCNFQNTRQRIIAISGVITNLSIIGNASSGGGAKSSNAYPAIDLGGGASNFVTISDNMMTGQHNYGLDGYSAATNITVKGNNFRTAVTARYGSRGTLSGSRMIDTGGFSVGAYCLFDGTGTPTILESGNIASITDNGVGDYTLNLVTPFKSANFVVVMSAGATNDVVTNCNPISASQIQVRVRSNASGYVDVTRISVIAMGDLA